MQPLVLWTAAALGVAPPGQGPATATLAPERPSVANVTALPEGRNALAAYPRIPGQLRLDAQSDEREKLKLATVPTEGPGSENFTVPPGGALNCTDGGDHCHVQFSDANMRPTGWFALSRFINVSSEPVPDTFFGEAILQSWSDGFPALVSVYFYAGKKAKCTEGVPNIVQMEPIPAVVDAGYEMASFTGSYNSVLMGNFTGDETSDQTTGVKPDACLGPMVSPIETGVDDFGVVHYLSYYMTFGGSYANSLKLSVDKHCETVWDTGMIFPADGRCGIAHMPVGFDISIAIDAINATTGGYEHKVPISVATGKRGIANATHSGATGPPSGYTDPVRPPATGVVPPQPGDAVKAEPASHQL